MKVPAAAIDKADHLAKPFVVIALTYSAAAGLRYDRLDKAKAFMLW